MYSPLLEIDIDQYPILIVDVRTVDPGANFSLEVQDFTGPAQTWVSQVTEPGIYSIDLRTLMGWIGTHRFYCSIWVGGGVGRGTNLRSVSVGEGMRLIETFKKWYADEGIRKHMDLVIDLLGGRR